METVVSVETMRRSDAGTIARGIDGCTLMYRAGEGIFSAYPWQEPVAVVCGSGNNAGDGYVLALLLARAGIPCRIFLPEERFSEDGRFYFEQCRAAGIGFEICGGTPDFSGYAEIADCLLGTGFRGEVRGMAASVISRINQSGAAVVSADINSGLSGDGFPTGLCVISALTVSVGYYKIGHFLGAADQTIGRLTNCNIGISLFGEGYPLFSAEEAADFVCGVGASGFEGAENAAQPFKMNASDMPMYPGAAKRAVGANTDSTLNRPRAENVVSPAKRFSLAALAARVPDAERGGFARVFACAADLTRALGADAELSPLEAAERYARRTGECVLLRGRVSLMTDGTDTCFVCRARGADFIGL